MTSIAAVTTVSALIAETPAADDPATVNDFLHRWDEAWAKHDAAAIAALHTENAVTVNRFGTLVRGKADLSKALGFLHGVHGPFQNSVFSRLWNC